MSQQFKFIKVKFIILMYTGFLNTFKKYLTTTNTV